VERLANRFVRFPCNVGDTVFTTYSNKVEVEEVVEIRIYKNDRAEFIYQYLINGGYVYFDEDDIGKNVFFTYEEAEKEIKNKLQSHAEEIIDERNGR
jgi:hypothetical protein